jgi:hypothetical protein
MLSKRESKIKNTETASFKSNNCMIPSKDIGNAVDLVDRNSSRDFSSLMPRPGWQVRLGFWVFDL